MDNKNRVKLADFIRGSLRGFLILIFMFLIQYSVIGNEDPVKTFTPDPQIQAQLSRTISTLNKYRHRRPNIKEEDATKELDKLKEMGGKDIKKFLPQLLYYRANLQAKESEMDPITFDENFGHSWDILAKLYPYPDVSKRDRLEAALPYFGTKDPYWQSDLNRLFSRLALDEEKLYKVGKIEYDLSEFESFIKERKENPPLVVLQHMYQVNPNESVLVMIHIYMPEDETKEMEAKIMEVKGLIWGVSDRSRSERIKKTREALSDLSQHKEWWVRLYVAEMIRQYKDYGSPDIIERLENDKHPLVRETMKQMSEKLLQEVK